MTCDWKRETATPATNSSRWREYDLVKEDYKRGIVLLQRYKESTEWKLRKTFHWPKEYYSPTERTVTSLLKWKQESRQNEVLKLNQEKLTIQKALIFFLTTIMIRLLLLLFILQTRHSVIRYPILWTSHTSHYVLNIILLTDLSTCNEIRGLDQRHPNFYAHPMTNYKRERASYDYLFQIWYVDILSHMLS